MLNQSGKVILSQLTSGYACFPTSSSGAKTDISC